MKKVLVVNNYDSFVYNLTQMLSEAGVLYDVVLNDALPWESLDAYDRILLSPGPGIPEEAGDLLSLIECTHKTHSILGVCLGHQAIGQFFGATIKLLPHPRHGHASPLSIFCPEDVLYRGIDQRTIVGRYHSWVLDPVYVPSCLQVTAVDEEDNIMSFTHRDFPLYGVQFHPESIISQQGRRLLENWLKG